MSGCLSLVAVLALGAGEAVEAQQVADGLTVVVATLPAASTVSVQWVIRAGADDEQSSRLGLAHLVEHLVFRGEVARREKEKLVALGTPFNARTQADETVYELTATVENFEAAFGAFTRLLTDPKPMPQAIRSELGVVAQESEFRRSLKAGALERAVFGDPVVQGTSQALSRVSASDVNAFLERFYGPANSVLVVAGPVTLKTVLEVYDAQSRWPPVPSAHVPQPPKPVEGRIRVSLSNHESGLVLGALGFPASEFRACEEYAATLHSAVLTALPDNDRTVFSSWCTPMRGWAFAGLYGTTWEAPTGPIAEVVVAALEHRDRKLKPAEATTIQRRLAARHLERLSSAQDVATKLSLMAPYFDGEQLVTFGRGLLTAPGALTQAGAQGVGEVIVLLDGPFPDALIKQERAPKGAPPPRPR